MRISTTSNTTPRSTPPSSAGSRGEGDASAGDERLIWHSLVPRLVHPARLEIVEALIGEGRPMGVEQLVPLVSHAGGNTDLVRYHAKAMVEAGLLEPVAADQVQGGGDSEEPSLYFCLPK